ncbi:MAG: hypothetical protein MK098_03475 [Marinovum sp.]|nr:hypothetical protein [Marinovum sp.]
MSFRTYSLLAIGLSGMLYFTQGIEPRLGDNETTAYVKEEVASLRDRLNSDFTTLQDLQSGSASNNPLSPWHAYLPHPQDGWVNLSDTRDVASILRGGAISREVLVDARASAKLRGDQTTGVYLKDGALVKIEIAPMRMSSHNTSAHLVVLRKAFSSAPDKQEIFARIRGVTFHVTARDADQYVVETELGDHVRITLTGRGDAEAARQLLSGVNFKGLFRHIEEDTGQKMDKFLPKLPQTGGKSRSSKSSGPQMVKVVPRSSSSGVIINRGLANK